MANVTYRNPKQSIISTKLPLDIKEHHLLRTKQVLVINQSVGKFPQDPENYSVFMGRNQGPTIPGTRVLATKRRNLSTIQPKYIPYPGRIYITNDDQQNMAEAVRFFLAAFSILAPRGRWNYLRKRHYFRYSTSLAFYVNQVQYAGSGFLSRMENVEEGDLVEIVNYAPHAATLAKNKRDGMYRAAVRTRDRYGPGIQVSYFYINSDAVGRTYAKGYGGPSPETARATGRPYPVVYALPIVSFAFNTPGRSNSRFVKPGNSRRRVAARARQQQARI